MVRSLVWRQFGSVGGLAWSDRQIRDLWWDGPITLANNRAVTIYLWHNLLITATEPVIDQLWNIPYFGDHFGTYIGASYTVLMLLLVWPLPALTIPAIGWVEDVAAKRAPRLWPNGSRKRPG
ncbi:hypothetical protein ACFRQM_14550 [Streptomyces sp. NPDC056831]|uniref:hypothetical protein n=1 Tax=Streptomyces sp. NPDC056831 TaxID=3345954 RepID=UPI00368698C2